MSIREVANVLEVVAFISIVLAVLSGLRWLRLTKKQNWHLGLPAAFYLVNQGCFVSLAIFSDLVPFQLTFNIWALELFIQIALTLAWYLWIMTTYGHR